MADEWVAKGTWRRTVEGAGAIVGKPYGELKGISYNLAFIVF